MGEPARKLPTFEELLAEIDRLPEHLSGEVLVPGEIRTMTRPLAPHRRAMGSAHLALGPADRARGGGWWIELEPAIRFGDRLCNPDIAAWRVETCPDPPDGHPITIIPDFCCEVLSPSTGRDDRIIKLPHYARSGVSWIWLIDPALRTVEVFETHNERPMLVATAKEDDTLRLPPFELEISLAPFWMPPKTSEPTEPSSP